MAGASSLPARAYRRGLEVFVARTFRFWQRLGLHVVLNRFDQPVPDTRTLSETHWSMKSELVGIDVRRHDERTAGSVWIRYVA